MGKGKTSRFGDLVRGSGRPEVVTLWVEPKKDKNFSKAIEGNRVLTVLTDPGSHRKEYGLIGFHQQEGAIYLVFPKELPPPESVERVVGINFQLAEDRPVTDPVTTEFEEELAPKAKIEQQKRAQEAHKVEENKETGSGSPQESETKAAPPAPVPPQKPPKVVKPKLKTFEVTVRRIATIEEKRRIKAETEQAAKEEAMKAAKAKPFAINRADLRIEVTEVNSGE